MKWLAVLFFNASTCLMSLWVCAAPIPVYQINEEGHTWLQFPLTHDIYSYSADVSLNSLVVLDNKGNKLPYRIIVPPLERKEMSAKVPLRFFPVVAGTSLDNIKELDSASIRIYNNEVSIEVKHKTDNLSSASADFYIADISELKTKTQHLELDWNAGDANQYLEVQVSASRDLQDWEFISGYTLVKLQKDDQWLVRNSIPLDLAKTDYAYLRLEFGRGGEGLQLNSIHVKAQENQLKAYAREEWEVKGLSAADQQSALRTSISKTSPVAAWEYERKDRAPVTRIGINLGNNYYGDNIHIYSRRTHKQPWQLLHQGVWFNVQVGSDWQHSDTVSIYANSDPYWRIELNDAVREAHNPILVFEQQQQILQFVANNTAPYRIAFDNGATTNHRHIYAQIFSQLVGDKEQQWITAIPIILSPDTGALTQEPTQVNWKTWLFWCALLMGVAILVGLAIRLSRQMKPS